MRPKLWPPTTERITLSIMDTMDFGTGVASSRPSESEADEQRRLADEADARDPGGADMRHARTLRALADVDAGRLIDDEAMQAWADSLDTAFERPVPQPD